MIKAEDFLKLEELINELARKSINGSIIIVEGIKDVTSLRELGIGGEILTSSSTPDVDLVDRIGRDNNTCDVIILTDNDRAGGNLEKSLTAKFSTWGVTPNTEFKKRIFSIVSREIYSIEELANLYKKAKKENRC